MSPPVNTSVLPCIFALATALATLLMAPGTNLAANESPAEPPTGRTIAQPPPEPASPESPAGIPQEAAVGKTPAERDADFRKMVTNVRLVGNFTMDGADEAKLQREEYAITGAIKLGNGDYWVLTSRIKYGDVDLTVPVPVQVKWAGHAPVITVDSVKIPALGTFSARVLLDEARYAGTWSHDEKGGHLFGVIKRDGVEAQ
ncbi:MAG: hypothetical protein WED27_11580 [Pirellulales bacterium]